MISVHLAKTAFARASLSTNGICWSLSQFNFHTSTQQIAQSDLILKQRAIETGFQEASKIKLSQFMVQNFSTKSTTTIPPAANSNEINEITKKILELRKKFLTNPYNIYAKETLPKARAENSDKKATDLVRTVGNQWKTLSIEQKLPFFEMAEKNRNEQSSEISKLLLPLNLEETREVKAVLKKKNSDRRKELKGLRVKREKKKLGQPKQPAGSFMLFCQTLDRGDAPISEFSKGASRKWHALPQQDKEKFFEQFKKNNEEYTIKKKEWEAKMLVMGKPELLRKESRRKYEKNLKSKDEIQRKRLAKRYKLKSIKSKLALKGKKTALIKLKRELKNASKTIKILKARKVVGKSSKKPKITTKSTKKAKVLKTTKRNTNSSKKVVEKKSNVKKANAGVAVEPLVEQTTTAL